MLTRANNVTGSKKKALIAPNSGMLGVGGTKNLMLFLQGAVIKVVH